MARFEVWAPNARRVDLDLPAAATRVEMAAGAHGWFSADVGQAGPGTDYGFVLDGEGPFPDPRSMWQPSGVHGPSRVVDHEAFEWHDRGWHGRPLAGCVLYELHVGTFSPEGTFDGAAARLDHLVDLGVDAVELMPIIEFPGRWGWGYDGVDLFAVRGAYGGPDGLKRLVDACHRRGLAVVIDVVYNHLGPDGNYLGRFGPYFTDRYGTPWGQAVNYDGPGSGPVRRFVIDNALLWLRDYHADGLRLDATEQIYDRSARHVLQELADEVAALSAHVGRTLWLIAESDMNDPRWVEPPQLGGFGLDAVWSDDFHHAVHAALTGERTGYYADFGDLDDVATAFEDTFVYGGRWSNHRNRVHGRAVGDLWPRRFVVFDQNHDQIGNRAAGERLGALVGRARAKIAAALVLCSPFVPLVFQGEEWDASTPFQYFTDHTDPDLAEAVRTGRRREFAAFGWKPEDVPDPQDPATFERSCLLWDEVTSPEHVSMLDWYRSLIELRRRVPGLGDGRPHEVHVRVDHDCLVVTRGALTVAANLGAEPATVVVAAPGRRRSLSLLLASAAEVRLDCDALWLPPDAVAVVRGSDPEPGGR